MNFQPAFRCHVRDLMKSAGIFAGVLAAIQLATAVAVLLMLSGSASTDRTATGYCIPAAVFMLVVGICSPREQLRLCIQNGVSRKTAFYAELAAFALISMAVAVFGEILVSLGDLLARIDGRFVQVDLYQLIYVGTQGRMGLGQRLLSVLFGFVTLLAASVTGSLISLGFYRLNKGWTIAVAVGVPLFFTVGLPMLMMIPAVFDLVTRPMLALFRWLLASVWNYLLLGLVGCGVVSALNRLLSMRAAIRAAK